MSKETSQTSQTLTISQSADAEVGDDDLGVDDVHFPGRKAGSRADLRDMIRMGRRQEFSRNFNFLSVVGFSSLAISTWTYWNGRNLGVSADGGLANDIWVYVCVFPCWLAVVSSIAEMASMAATAGGQYVWVSEFAPRRIQRSLSYVTGWICVLGWHMAFVSLSTGASSSIQTWFALSGKHLEFNLWQTSFIQIATAVGAIVFNTNAGNSLPLLGGSLAILYFLTFFAIIIPLWVLSPRADPDTVFLNFSAHGDDKGLAHNLIFAIFSPIFSMMAPDVAIHLGEEVKNSSLVLPRALMTSTVLNGILGFAVLLTLSFTGGDLAEASSGDVGFSFQVMLNATGSPMAVYIIATLLAILNVAGCFAAATASSRQLFAFARDKGVPFSGFLSHVRPGWNIPFNALIVSLGIVALVALIHIGASRALDSVGSVAVSGLLFSYLVSISCVRLKRWRNEPLPSRRWSLGRLGGPINDVAILFLAFCLGVFFYPYHFPITTENFNYAIVVFICTILLSLIFYFVKGRHVYIAPRSLVRKDV